MVLTLHWLNKSKGHRILWLLEELGVPYEIKTYQRDEKTGLGDPDLKKIHPLGKSPTIEDDGKVVAETGLIIEYLCGKYGKGTALEPKDADEEFDVKFALHHGEGSVSPVVILMITTSLLKGEAAPMLARPLTGFIANKIEGAYPRQDLIKQLDFLEDQLKKAGSGFFVGDHISGADIMYLWSLQQVFIDYKGFGVVNEGDYPLLRKWVKSVHERPAMIAAYKKVPEDLPDASNV